MSSSQKLDLFLPPGQGPFPLVIYIHGGGFILGDKTERTVDELRAPLLNEGYALASLNYRLTNEAPFPAQIRDIKTAVRWLRAHAGEFRLNPNEVAVWGASAGGSLAALLGTSCGIPALEGFDLGSAHQSSCVQAAVDWFGPSDLLQMDDEPISASCPKPKPSEDPSLTWPSLYVGGLLQEHQAVAHAANPITYITPDDPPVLIEQGTRDCIVPPEQSQMLHDAVELVMGNGGAILRQMQGAGHYDPAFVAPANIRFVLDFLDGHLK